MGTGEIYIMSLDEFVRRYGIGHHSAVMAVFLTALIVPVEQWEGQFGWHPRWLECEAIQALVAMGND